MPRLSEPRNAALLLAGTAAVSMAAVAALWLGAAPAAVPAGAAVIAVQPWLHPEPFHAARERDPLDELRNDAAIGNTDASLMLAQHLMARFEWQGDSDDLHEAVQWISRDWDRAPYVTSDIVTQLVEFHCGRPVVRWHWLCQGGD